MWRSVSTEASGWREALADRGVVLAVALRVVLAASLALCAAVASRHAGPAVVALGAAGGALLASLALLRLRGRP